MLGLDLVVEGLNITAIFTEMIKLLVARLPLKMESRFFTALLALLVGI